MKIVAHFLSILLLIAGMLSFRLQKVDERNDDFLIIEGTATAEETDRDGERLDYEGSKPWFRRWIDAIRRATGGKSQGNIRAQHDPKLAVGIIQDLTFDDVLKRISIVCKIVDADTISKILAGVYSAFSIAGRYIEKYLAADGVTMYICDPCEISVVDFPALPSATFDIVNKSGAVERRHFQQGADMSPDHVRHCLAAATHHDAMAESCDKDAKALDKAAAERRKCGELHKAQAGELRKMASAPTFGEVAAHANDGKSLRAELLKSAQVKERDRLGENPDGHGEWDPSGGIGGLGR